ncbi:MAG TPA: hypothetical protein VGQ52_03990 [Gemmatimonadaceae bacterium]|jgi:hypothetical protein|nr:hypothetical protein [Gemmatimonadaceae bacterium]
MVPRSAVWIVGRLLPKADSDALLGDLVEEQALRQSGEAPPNESWWYWSQVSRSLGPLLWAAARRGRWLGIITVAITIYVLITVLESYSDALLSKLFVSGGIAFTVASLAFSPVAMGIGGYAAARMRRGAAAVLAILSAVAIIRLMVLSGNAVAIAYLTAFLVICPLTALAGGALVRRRARTQ